MRAIAGIVLLLLVTISLSSCGTSTKENVVEVAAHDFSFVVADEIKSGWTTFRFINAGHAEHFFLLNMLPDSIPFAAYHSQVSRPFDVVFDSLKAGMSKADAIGLLVGSLPSWYFAEVKTMGGTGIVDAGLTAQTTLKLEPGTYVMECYIKEKGVFHTALGMMRTIEVTGETSAMDPPTPDVEITLTNFQYDIAGELKAGSNTVAVHFQEQPEAGLGNDVHLIRMTDDTDLDEVIEWMDWMNVGGLQSPAPVEFLGGTQEMPVGHTSYFTVDLTPGEYAFIAESAAAKGMVTTFTVE